MTLVNQRHHLVLLFTDLTDSTRIAADMEPEIYADLLTRLRELTNRIIAHHGGEVVRIDGDGALCIFGYPVAYEDAGRRATEAALDLHEAIAALDHAIEPGLCPRLHSGIHAGVVLLRSGDMVRGRYEMLGDATNIAARLCDASSPDGLLVSAETLGGDANFFEVGDPVTLQPGGRRKALRALPILGRSAMANRYQARTRDRLTPLAGRVTELATFRAWLQGGPAIPPVLLAHGPAGIGKTRLLGLICESAREAGWRVARGYCEAYLAARPLQPFLQVAGELAGGDMTDLPTGAISIGAELANAARDMRIMVVIDDWQWADDASRDQLAELLALAPPGQLRVVLASRESDARLADGQPCTHLPVEPLDSQAAQGAIAALIGAVEPFVAERIAQAAGGSPLLIEELCHAVASGAATPDSDPRGAWFDLAVQSRFAALAPVDAAMLRHAAIIGHLVPSWLLAAVQGEAIGAAMLDRLEAADFLFPGDTGNSLRFKHGLTRDAVYAGIDLRLRRDLHRRVLAALELRAAQIGDAGLLDALAYHSQAAGLGDEALGYAMRAGDAALAAGALDRAQAHYRAAFDRVEAMPDSPSRREHCRQLLNKFGLASIVDPSADQLAVLERAQAILHAAQDLIGELRSAYWLGAIAYGVGLGQRSVRHLEQARELAELVRIDRYFDQIDTKLAQSLSLVGRYDEADTLFGSVLPRIRERYGRNDRETLIYALCCHGFLLADRGQIAAAHALYAEAEQLDPAALANMRASLLAQKSAIALWVGDWADAERLAEASLLDCTRIRTRYLAMMSHALAAYARWRIDGSDAQVTRIEETARWFTTKGNSRQRTSLVFGWLADVKSRQGDYRAARFHAAEAVRRVREGGDRLGEGMAWRAMARSAQAQGQPLRADHYLGLAQHSAALRKSAREQAMNRYCAAELAQARGHSEHARAAREESAAQLAALGIDRLARLVASR